MREKESIPEKQYEEIDQEILDVYLSGDYLNNNGLNHVLGWLCNVADNLLTRDKFFEIVKPETIYTVEEYFEKKLEPIYGLTWPREISAESKAKIKRIDAIVIELREAVKNRCPLKEIYQILVRFGAELGREDVLLQRPDLPAQLPD